MSSQLSQILSNFKLFSQNDEPISNKTLLAESTLKYKLTLGFLVAVIITLVYFRREELSVVFAGWINTVGLQDFLGNLWLTTHLTPTGELASTYVPSDFASFLGDTVESASLPSV